MATLRSERLISPRPELASVISKWIEKFAQEHGLRWQAWHQDDPIWQIWHEEVKDDKIIRKILQISAYASQGELPLLKAIGLGQVIDEVALVGKVLRTPKVIDQKPLAQIGDDLNLLAFIEKSWMKVMEIQEKDFPPEGIKLPPKPANRPS